MQRRAHARLAALMAAAIVCASSVRGVALACTADDPLAGETIVDVWNEATLEAIREASVPAPLAARTLAIVDTSMYDAWAAYDADARGTDGTSRLRRPATERTQSNVKRAVSIAAFYALRDVAAVPMADITLSQLGQPLGRNDAPERVGREAAEAVLASRHGDGSNQRGDRRPGAYSDYTNYHSLNTATVVANASHWQPLLVYNDAGGFKKQTFLVPQWGYVRPFAIDAAALTQTLAPPAAAGTPAYVAQARGLLDISAHLTGRQKTIAEYWADGMMTDSPPGHWERFGIWISKRDRHDVGADAKMFFALSNALLDASILCWRVKRTFDSERPITAIHALFGGSNVVAWAGPNRGTAAIDGGSWIPYQPANIVTPAFPEYVSGHSTFSAAAAEVLRRFTGSDTFGASYAQKPGTSIVEPGEPKASITLTWPTFSDAAAEAGMSRRYGGIHFETGDLEGRRMGRIVGAIVYERAESFFSTPYERAGGSHNSTRLPSQSTIQANFP